MNIPLLTRPITPIQHAQILMDQSCVAGVGNIYRAEILFKSGVHPEQPARTILRHTFEAIWGHSVLLLQRGFLTGSILTVDPEEARVLGPRWSRRYIYNQVCDGLASWSVDWLARHATTDISDPTTTIFNCHQEHLRPLQGLRALL